MKPARTNRKPMGLERFKAFAAVPVVETENTAHRHDPGRATQSRAAFASANAAASFILKAAAKARPGPRS